jgi:hypothetical protein
VTTGTSSEHIKEKDTTMNTYTITTRSVLYCSYEVEAETEAEARKILEGSQFYSDLTEVHSWTEDTEIYEVELEEEGEEQ